MRLKQIFKERVTRKLAIYSLIILIIFSMIVASVFMIFLEKYIINNDYIVNDQKENIIENAKNIAKRIYIDENNKVYINDRLQSDGDDLLSIYKKYLYEFADLEETYTWIINKDRELLVTDNHFIDEFDYYSDLTEYEKNVINLAFDGEEIVFNSFSYFTNEILITAGVPIYKSVNMDIEGKDLIGVLLVKSVVKPTRRVLINGFIFMFWSLVIAFIFSYILLILFSHKFTRSLYKMRDNAFELSKGNYDVRNNIFQDDEIGYLANTLDFLSLKLKEADEQKKNLDKLRSDFISNISHELMTPTTVVLGSLEALVDGVVKNEEDIKEYHINMLNEARFLSRLIGDLLEITRLQNVDFVIEKTHLSILDVISDVVRSLRNIARKKNISINLTKNEFKNEIYGDYGRLRQMFTIVLDNAIKFSELESSVEILLSGNQVKIRDFGTGIKDDDLPYIFDRFYKERSEKNKVGTGLGLSIAKSIANRHDIELKVKSVYGEYTEFIFEY